jgi:hypothetical protein
VPMADLRIGGAVDVVDGAAQVVGHGVEFSSTQIANLSVPRANAYRIGHLGVLVHNDCRGRRFDDEQAALIDMAKHDKRRGGVTRGDAEAYKKLGDEVGVPVRGPEIHPHRPNQDPHIHVGPVDHIPVKD